MAKRVNARLLEELKGYGASDISACFNCGNCTAVCPLAEAGASFPRRLVRMGQIGDREGILRAKEPWLCYYCAECSETCPRQAEPGEYLASLRRLQVATLDPTGLGKLIYRHSWFALLFSMVTACFLGFLLVRKPASSDYFTWLFRETVAYETIHNLGIGVAVLLTALMTASLISLVHRTEILPLLKNLTPKLVMSLLSEIRTMRRHGTCHEQSYRALPWYRDPRYIHLAIMWGFLALAAATTMDFLVLFLLPKVFPSLGTITVFYPARFLGTLGGLVMLWGVSVAFLRRVTKRDQATRKSTFSDFWLIGYLWVLAVTGFWLEIVVTMRTPHMVNDWVLVLHAAMAMQLVLFIGMTKLAHAVYRPIMLFKHFLQKEGAGQ